MQSVRVIPAWTSSREVVKGVEFAEASRCRRSCELAARYRSPRAPDELGCLRSATLTLSDVRSHELRRWSVRLRKVFHPLPVRAAVSVRCGRRALLRAGADKVAVNFPAVAAPKLIDALASSFGAQCSSWRSTPPHRRRQPLGGLHPWWEASDGPRRGEWAVVCARLGAGENPSHLDGPGRD